MQKILHRIFFNFDDGPDPFQTYLDTWKKELPDFTIMEWDKTNLPLDLNEYTRTLSKEKNHAFLSDYFRCWLLKNYGGVYLDADIEILDGNEFRMIYEETQVSSDYDMFIGVESSNNGLLTAHSMGIKEGANHEILDFLLNLYETHLSSELHYYVKRFPIPDLLRLYFIIQEKEGNSPFSQNGFFKQLKLPITTCKMKIFPQDYFSPLTDRNEQEVITAFSVHTCICHHFAATWRETVKGKQSKNFKEGLIDNDYLPAPLLIPEIRKRYPELSYKHFKRPRWALKNEQIKFFEGVFNFFIPYQSRLFFSLKSRHE
ncbi:MAG: hypothetical protein LBR35_02645 [Rickettsiales bacterium]|jgi:hypothetical protein|nr:hypothetical protein [Rickettsiales bacterium]